VGRLSVRRPVLRLDVGPDGAGPGVRAVDTLAAEEPLEIRVDGSPLAVTMRTPGDDMDLAAGFLVTEGVVTDRDELLSLRFCAGAEGSELNSYNVLDANLDAVASARLAANPGVSRELFASSSCGICGKSSIDAIRTRTAWPVQADALRISARQLSALPDQLRAGQRVFSKTGGLHGAALFDPDGMLLALREDIGRHNAVDKLVGWALREGLLPLRGVTLLVSGRASFELTQKAVMAGIPLLAAVSAPSSLAVELAEECGLTLVGFLRGTTMNVYAGAERIVAGADSGLVGITPAER
jgi:FdhD protein